MAVPTDSRQNVAITFAANVTLALLNAASGVLLARALGAEHRGELQAVQIWGLVLGTIAALGVPDAIVYFAARRRADTGNIVASGIVLTIAPSLVFMAIGWAAMPYLLAAQSAEVVALARVFLLTIPVSVTSLAAMQALRGYGSFTRWNLLRIVPAALWCLLVVGAAVAGRATVGFLTYGFMATLGAVLVLNLVVLARTAGGPWHVETDRWPGILRFGLPNTLSTVPQLLNLRLDQMMLTAFVGPTRLGLYVAGVAWAGVLAPVLSSLGYVLFPRVAQDPSREEQLRVTAKGFRAAVVIAVAMVSVVMLLTAPILPRLFGAEFAAAVPAALVLVAAGGVLAVAQVLQDGFRGLGLPSVVLWSELSGLVATAVLLAALLSSYDIMGAAIASLGGYSIVAGYLIVRLHRLGARGEASLVPTPTDAIMVVRAIASLARRRSPRPDEHVLDGQ